MMIVAVLAKKNCSTLIDKGNNFFHRFVVSAAITDTSLVMRGLIASIAAHEV
jgi:hypothetical protein